MGDLDVLVQLEVAGEEAANRATAALKSIGAAAGGGTGGGGGGDGEGASGKLERLRSAFEKVEQHEPSRFLRQGTFALESLALGAIGAEGPAARLAATLGLFTAGTGVGLGLLTFTAAAAAGWNIFTASLRETNKEIDAAQKNLGALAALPKEATDRLTLMQGRGALQQLQQRTTFETTVSETSFLEKLAVLLPGGGIGFSTGGPRGVGITLGEQTGAVAEAARTRQAMEESGMRAQLNRAAGVIQAELDRQERQRIQTLELEALAVGKARLGTTATVEQLEFLAREVDAVKLQTSTLTPKQREHVLNLEAEARALDAANAAHQRFLNQPATPGTGNQTQAGQGFVRTGATYGRAPQIDEFGRPIEDYSEGTELARVGVLGRTGGLIGTNRATATTGGMDGRQLAAIMGQTLGMIGNVAQGGGIASVLTGVGGIAAAVPGGQLPGALLSGLGGLVGLFSSGGAKFSIARIEQEALAQLRDVLQIPKAVSVVVAPGGGDARQTRYEQSRLAAKSGVTTLPFG